MQTSAWLLESLRKPVTHEETRLVVALEQVGCPWLLETGVQAKSNDGQLWKRQNKGQKYASFLSQIHKNKFMHNYGVHIRLYFIHWITFRMSHQLNTCTITVVMIRIKCQYAEITRGTLTIRCPFSKRRTLSLWNCYNMWSPWAITKKIYWQFLRVPWQRVLSAESSYPSEQPLTFWANDTDPLVQVTPPE